MWQAPVTHGIRMRDRTARRGTADVSNEGRRDVQHFTRRSARRAAGLILPIALGGCNAVVLNPAGDVAIQQRDLIIVSTVLMLIIIVPVMVLTVWFAWHYRASNKKAEYDPDWHHSTSLELVIWAAPLLIIIFLGAVTWSGTHLLDPYRPLDRIDASRPVPTGTEPLDIQVVSMDWKWLFIYPQYGIASLNQMAAPIDRPIRFSLTSQNMMNSFFVPAIAGQIYTMPGMQTTLHAIANRAGNYRGFSANLSGLGFAKMDFRFLAMSPADFGNWLDRARADKGRLDRAEYIRLETPSVSDPVRYFGTIEKGLFERAVNRCVAPGAPCLRAQMAAAAGQGHPPPAGSGAAGAGTKATGGGAAQAGAGAGN